MFKKYESYNRALFELVKQYRARYGDRIRVATAIKDFEIGADDVSIDCFHPNYRLQKRVAETSWAYSWWAPSN